MSNIDGLAASWFAIKEHERLIVQERHEIESQLIEALSVKSEGSITHTLEHFKVVLTQPVYRTLDQEKFDLVRDKVDPSLHPIQTVVKADGVRCRKLEEDDPLTWMKLAPAFTKKKGKVGVKVERLKDGN